MKRARRQGPAAALAVLLSAAAWAYPPPPPDPSVPASEVPPAVQQVRRAMLDPEINALTFQSMDRIFTTRAVPRSGPVWPLARNDRELDFTYTYDNRKLTPGSVFEYKTLDTAVLGWLLERVTGNTVAAYTARKLWEPLGAEADGFYIMDGAPGVGREFSGAGFNATLRDFARFGQMVLDGGVANGRRIVSAEWIRESTSPTQPRGTGGRPGYGYQWWMAEGASAFQAIGLQGQFIYIDPATRTVIVKLSYFPPGNTTADAESAAFFAAASRWVPTK
jgi:CubicO group peptidase (beta-lactamase class C family)